MHTHSRVRVLRRQESINCKESIEETTYLQLNGQARREQSAPLQPLWHVHTPSAPHVPLKKEEKKKDKKKKKG